MARTIEIPFETGDKVYTKLGKDIRELEIESISVSVYRDCAYTSVRAFVEGPDPLYLDGRTMKRIVTLYIGSNHHFSECAFLSREEAEAYYANRYV